MKIADVRKCISKACYQRSMLITWFWLMADMALFLISILFTAFVNSPLLKLLGALTSGCAVAMLFIWAHDAAHGALFKSKKVAELLGTLAMLPSLNVYRLWCYGHNRSHHGFTSLTPVDWVWRPLSREQYAVQSKLQQFLYRIERSLVGCGLHYFRRVWWEVMVRFNPGKDTNKKRYYHRGKFAVLAYMLIIGSFGYYFAGGIIGIFCVLIIPFIIFNYCIAFITYLHHTHQEIPFFENKNDWSNTIGYMHCCTIIRMNGLLESLTHNIFIHVPHHVDMRIPFYRLKQASYDLEMKYGDHIHRYQFSWKKVRSIFKHCKLYDFRKQKWQTYE